MKGAIIATINLVMICARSATTNTMMHRQIGWLADTTMTGVVVDWGQNSSKKDQVWAGNNCIKGGD
ncbi:MAG: hypothetical protein ACSHXY_05995 [Alphaproteobacteria bacterium]